MLPKRLNGLGFCHSQMSFHSRVRIMVETAEFSGMGQVAGPCPGPSLAPIAMFFD